MDRVRLQVSVWNTSESTTCQNKFLCLSLNCSSAHDTTTGPAGFLTTHSCSLDSSVYLFKTSTPINVCFSFLESELTFSNVLFFDHNPKRFCSRPEN